MSNLDNLYQLEELTALRLEKTLESGTTKPAITRCLNPLTGERKDCVVKMMGGERMGPEAAARELLATFIAWEWDLKVVEPVLVNITQEFVSTLIGCPEYSIAAKSIGLNYGSIYQSGPKSLPLLQTLNNFELEHAQYILAFDVFVGNADRTFEKPNFLADGVSIIILDHEQAFGHVREIFPNPEPWNFREIDQVWLNKLILRFKIKGKKLPEAEIKDRLGRINDVFWDKALKLIPNEWHTDQLLKIRDYLDKFVENKDKFVENLKTLVV